MNSINYLTSLVIVMYSVGYFKYLIIGSMAVKDFRYLWEFMDSKQHFIRFRVIK
jgi:hypothetical protein